MEGSGHKHELSLRVSPSDLSQIARVRRLVEHVALEAGASEERVFDLKVAVSEACANAIEHSAEQDEVDVRARIEDHRVVFEVCGGGAFQLDRPGRDRSEHRGMGLPLMVRLMDEVRIQRHPRSTSVRLTVDLG